MVRKGIAEGETNGIQTENPQPASPQNKADSSKQELSNLVFIKQIIIGIKKNTTEEDSSGVHQ